MLYKHRPKGNRRGLTNRLSTAGVSVPLALPRKRSVVDKNTTKFYKVLALAFRDLEASAARWRKAAVKAALPPVRSKGRSLTWMMERFPGRQIRVDLNPAMVHGAPSIAPHRPPAYARRLERRAAARAAAEAARIAALPPPVVRPVTPPPAPTPSTSQAAAENSVPSKVIIHQRILKKKVDRFQVEIVWPGQAEHEFAPTNRNPVDPDAVYVGLSEKEFQKRMKAAMLEFAVPSVKFVNY